MIVCHPADFAIACTRRLLVEADDTVVDHHAAEGYHVAVCSLPWLAYKAYIALAALHRVGETEYSYLMCMHKSFVVS